MTKSFMYPSAEFPDFPRLTITVPDDWSPVAVPGGLLAARATRSPADFSANVILTIGRYDRDFSAADALGILRRGLRDHPEATVSEPFTATVGKDRYLIVHVFLQDPQAGHLLQVHAYCAYPVPGLNSHIDIVHVMGTCAAAERQTDYPLLQEAVNSLRVAPPVTMGRE